MSDSVTASRTDPDVALVLGSYEAYAVGEIDRAVEPLHPDVEWIEPDEFPNGGRRQGPAAVAQYLSASRAMWDELVSETTPYRRGDKIVIVHHVQGRTVDGVIREATVADVFTVADGQVIRMQAYADPNLALATDFS